MILLEYFILILASVAFGFDTELRTYTKIVGLELSATKTGTGYQDAITPREWNVIFVSSIAVSLTIIIIAFIYGSVGTGFVCIAIAYFGPIVTRMIITPAGKETILKDFILRYLFASMNRRYKKYKKQNDNAKADAMNGLIQKFKKKYK